MSSQPNLVGVQDNLSEHKLKELAKNPANQVYQYTSEHADTGPLSMRFSFVPTVTIDRFQQLRIDFELMRAQFPNLSEEQLKFLVLRIPKNRHLIMFVDQHTKLSEHIFSKKFNNRQISEFLNSMRTAMKEKNVLAPRTAENRIGEDHPHYKESMNKRNQTFIKEIFQRGLVSMKPIDKPDQTNKSS